MTLPEAARIPKGDNEMTNEQRPSWIDAPPVGHKVDADTTGDATVYELRLRLKGKAYEVVDRWTEWHR
jgi:hypothetical protein